MYTSRWRTVVLVLHIIWSGVFTYFMSASVWNDAIPEGEWEYIVPLNFLIPLLVGIYTLRTRSKCGFVFTIAACWLCPFLSTQVMWFIEGFFR